MGKFDVNDDHHYSSSVENRLKEFEYMDWKVPQYIYKPLKFQQNLYINYRLLSINRKQQVYGS